MRLICPSCGAQYEVDESVIPETGRDVQCSNCGHAWFQSRTEAAPEAEEAAVEEGAPPPVEPDADAAADDAGAAPDAAEVEAEAASEAEEPPLAEDEAEPEEVVQAEVTPEADETAEAEAKPDTVETPEAEAKPDAAETPEAEAAPKAEDTPEVQATPKPLDIVKKVDEAQGSAPPPSPAPDDAAADAAEAASQPAAPAESYDDDDEPLPVAPKPELKRRKLDDTVLGVLREEAERENRVRKVEDAALESQPDLGLAAMADASGDKTRDRVVRVRGDEDDLDDDALVARASRRELLPDIEEIKSTLRATSERGDEPASIDAPETLARRNRSGFRRGFAVSLLIALVAVLVYLLAPTISASVPALEPALTSYVEGVNAARIWLDTQMRSLTDALKASTGGQ